MVYHPKKIYPCPCLTHIINQISSLDIRTSCGIKRAIEDLHWVSDGGQVDSICADNKKMLCFYVTHT